MPVYAGFSQHGKFWQGLQSSGLDIWLPYGYIEPPGWWLVTSKTSICCVLVLVYAGFSCRVMRCTATYTYLLLLKTIYHQYISLLLLQVQEGSLKQHMSNSWHRLQGMSVMSSVCLSQHAQQSKLCAATDCSSGWKHHSVPLTASVESSWFLQGHSSDRLVHSVLDTHCRHATQNLKTRGQRSSSKLLSAKKKKKKKKKRNKKNKHLMPSKFWRPVKKSLTHL